MKRTDVSIIIPAFNEAHSIGALVSTIKGLYPHFEIIVVNDGSTDDTKLVASQAGAVVYSHPYNIGNGAAIKSGIRLASGEILIFMDADGQHAPEDIEKLLQLFPDYDMVVGARHKGAQASWWRAIANKFYNGLASYATNFCIKDLTSGFRAVKAEVVKHFLYLLPNTYSYPSTLTLVVLRSGRSLKYVPITAQGRKGGKSKIRLIEDGTRFFLIILKISTLYSPLRIFLPISAAVFLLGVLYYLYTFLAAGRFTNMGVLLLLTSLLIFVMGLISEQICQMRFEKSEGDRFV